MDARTMKLLLLLVVASTHIFNHCEALMCRIPPPSKQNFGASRGPFIWYEIYRYPHPLLDLNGQMTVNVQPLGSSNGVSVQANFTRNPMTLRGTGKLMGNQLCVQYEGLLGPVVSGNRNIVYTDNMCVYIDHFCLLDIEVSTIFYCKPEIPPGNLEEIWRIIDSSREVNRKRYRKIMP